MKVNWNDLVAIAEAKFQSELAKIEKLRRQTQALHADQARLRESAETGREALRGLHPAQSVNGDVAWQKWLSKTARSQKIQEAYLRAQMESHLPALRRAFGQTQAAQALADSAKKERAKSGRE